MCKSLPFLDMETIYLGIQWNPSQILVFACSLLNVYNINLTTRS